MSLDQIFTPQQILNIEEVSKELWNQRLIQKIRYFCIVSTIPDTSILPLAFFTFLQGGGDFQ